MSPKTKEAGTLPDLLYEASVTSIQSQVRRHYKKRKLLAKMPDEYRVQNSQQNRATQIQQYIKSILCHDAVGSVSGKQGYFSVHRSLTLIHHIIE